MVYLYVREAIFLLVAWAVFIQVRFWYRWTVFKRWSRQNGCEEVPVVLNKLPWGLERYAILVNGQFSSKFPISSDPLTGDTFRPFCKLVEG
jgi:hypothetical protein